jgi:hypothetical protein
MELTKDGSDDEAVLKGARNLGLVNSLRIARALSVPLSQLLADAEECQARG